MPPIENAMIDTEPVTPPSFSIGIGSIYHDIMHASRDTPVRQSAATPSVDTMT